MSRGGGIAHSVISRSTTTVYTCGRDMSSKKQHVYVTSPRCRLRVIKNRLIIRVSSDSSATTDHNVFRAQTLTYASDLLCTKRSRLRQSSAATRPQRSHLSVTANSIDPIVEDRLMLLWIIISDGPSHASRRTKRLRQRRTSLVN